jgi:hypothetical protein
VHDILHPSLLQITFYFCTVRCSDSYCSLSSASPLTPTTYNYSRLVLFRSSPAPINIYLVIISPNNNLTTSKTHEQQVHDRRFHSRRLCHRSRDPSEASSNFIAVADCTISSHYTSGTRRCFGLSAHHHYRLRQPQLNRHQVKLRYLRSLLVTQSFACIRRNPRAISSPCVGSRKRYTLAGTAHARLSKIRSHAITLATASCARK